jgi:hypothetical protein
LITIVDADPKDPIQHLYCGLKNMKPSTTCTPFRNLNDGDFVFVKPHDLNLVLVWMGKTQSDVMKDEESAFFKMVKV